MTLPHLGTDEQFAAVREIFEACGFDELRVISRVEIKSISYFQTPRQGRRVALSVETPLDALIHLFLDGEALGDAAARALLPPGAVELLAAINLLVPESDAWRPTGLIYPTAGLLMASDLVSDPLPPDSVYPAVVENTREFIEDLPTAPCEAALDLGTGTGIAALLATRQYARHAWGVDITARAAHFAEFNRRLNGVTAATMLEGDMYAPVEGLTFDRIFTHPPYVPAADTRMIFRDGGEDGEQILRRAIEGLPRFLRPGGMFYAFAMAADCEGETVEERVQKWLGANHEEFDLVLISNWLRAPAQYLEDARASGKRPEAERLYLEELWKRRKVQQLFYGGFLLRRLTEARPAVNIRVQRGQEMEYRHVAQVLEWEARAGNPASEEWLMSRRPAIAPACTMLVQYAVRDGNFAPQRLQLSCATPFASQCEVEPWVASAVSRCDGRITLREHVDEVIRGGQLPPGFPHEQIAPIFTGLISIGILTASMD